MNKANSFLEMKQDRRIQLTIV